jgi:hypothetical protein
MSMPFGLDKLNCERNRKVWFPGNDLGHAEFYNSGMGTPGHDWFIVEWAKTLGKRPVDFVRDLGWNKSRVSFLFNGRQQFNRETLNDVATYLNVMPYELLMHPSDAMALRRFRSAAVQLASEDAAWQAQETTDPMEALQAQTAAFRSKKV